MSTEHMSAAEAGRQLNAHVQAEVSQMRPVSPALAARIREGLRQSAAGEVDDLGDFTRYLAKDAARPQPKTPAQLQQAFADLRAWDEAFEAEHGDQG